MGLRWLEKVGRFPVEYGRRTKRDGGSLLPSEDQLEVKGEMRAAYVRLQPTWANKS